MAKEGLDTDDDIDQNVLLNFPYVYFDFLKFGVLFIVHHFLIGCHILPFFTALFNPFGFSAIFI